MLGWSDQRPPLEMDSQDMLSLALSQDGNVVVMGGRTSVEIWEFMPDDNDWRQRGQTLTPSSDDFDDSSYLLFGSSVAVSADGNVVAIAPSQDWDYLGQDQYILPCKYLRTTIRVSTNEPPQLALARGNAWAVRSNCGGKKYLMARGWLCQPMDLLWRHDLCRACLLGDGIQAH